MTEEKTIRLHAPNGLITIPPGTPFAVFVDDGTMRSTVRIQVPGLPEFRFECDAVEIPALLRQLGWSQ